MNSRAAESSKAKMISKVAFTLFLENGYEATGIRAICKAADAELPTLYYHFPSKKALLLSLAADLHNDYMASVPPSILDVGGNPEKRLQEYFLFIMHYTMTHIPETRFFLRYALFPPAELREEIQVFLQEDQKRKDELMQSAMMACIRSGLVNHSIENAMAMYWKFCTNNTFDAIMTTWKPNDRELLSLWKMFVHCQLSGQRPR